MRKKYLPAVMVSLLAVFMGLNLNAQEEKRFEIIENAGESQIGQYADLAIDLVENGYRNGSAISLVQAAAILTVAPMQTLVLSDAQHGEKTLADASLRSYAPDKLMADAKVMACNDRDLLRHINEFEHRLKDEMPTKGVTITCVSQKQIRVVAGATRIVYLDASVPKAKYSVRAKGFGTQLKMSVSSTWAGGEDKGTAEGTDPALTFWIGPAQQIKVAVTNCGNKTDFCTIVLEKITDSGEIIDAVEGVVETVDEVVGAIDEVIDLFNSIFGD